MSSGQRTVENLYRLDETWGENTSFAQQLGALGAPLTGFAPEFYTPPIVVWVH